MISKIYLKQRPDKKMVLNNSTMSLNRWRPVSREDTFVTNRLSFLNSFPRNDQANIIYSGRVYIY